MNVISKNQTDRGREERQEEEGDRSDTEGKKSVKDFFFFVFHFIFQSEIKIKHTHALVRTFKK